MEPEAKEQSRKRSIGIKNRIIEEGIIYLSPILAGIIFAFRQQVPVRELFVQVILCVLASCAFSLFLRIDQGFYRDRIRHPVYFFGCYILSFFWLGLSGAEKYGCMWFLLVVFTALDAGVELAVFSEMLLMLSYAVMTMQTTTNFRFFVTYFTLGMIMSVLFSVFRIWWEAGYLFFILMFFDAACRIFIYNFSLQDFFMHGGAFIQELISILALTLTGVFYVVFLSPGIRMERIIVKSTYVHKKISLEDSVEHEGEPVLAEEITNAEENVPEENVMEIEADVPEEKVVAVEADVPEEKVVAVEADVPEEKVVAVGESVPEEKAMAAEESVPEEPPVDHMAEPVGEEVEHVKRRKKGKTKREKVKREKAKKERVKKERIKKEKAKKEVVQAEPVKKVSAEEKILRKIIQPDFPLVQRLRQYSEALYEHSRKISVLSGDAAKLVGGDELLAKAGGMYHEIGRITPSGNYILAGEKIAREAGFPASVIPVIRQHSPMFELPNSREAAVVMLSDSIVSMEEYLIKNGQREQITDEHLIQNIFQKRIAKGNLDGVDFSDEDILKLKEYFIKNLSAM